VMLPRGCSAAAGTTRTDARTRATLSAARFMRSSMVALGEESSAL
jgi:hypothetical protein